jgi:hypothetical protein
MYRVFGKSNKRKGKKLRSGKVVPVNEKQQEVVETVFEEKPVEQPVEQTIEEVSSEPKEEIV